MSNILITGGTGSFGQEFTKHLLEKDGEFDKIIIYSRDEHKQEKMARRFSSYPNTERLRFFIGDIRDKDRLKLAAKDCLYIVHAAALKIVPAGEYNPMEFVKTNVLGAQNVIDVALSNPYTKVLALSTDKAVNPVNLYGATKLCMEKLFLASNNLVGRNPWTGFSIVRYGNVANSNGSVIPVFKKAYEAGEPLPITDARMTRFWIELDEAASFVYYKLINMVNGSIFIPNMPSFNILDLAAAFDEHGERRIKIVGIRPGEKLHEQIDQDLFSNTNARFLPWQELRQRLIALGILDG